MNWLVTLGSTIALLLSCAAAIALDEAALRNHWQWVRENPEERKIEKDGALRLRTQPGRIWAGKNDARNVLVWKSAVGPGPASFEATVTLEKPVNKYEQGGLLVYVDDDYFVKFVVEFIDGDYFVVMAREVKKRRQVLAKIQFKGKTARLRLEIDGDDIQGSYKTDLKSANWVNASAAELPPEPARRFALFTQDGPADKMGWALFRDIRVSGPSRN